MRRGKGELPAHHMTASRQAGKSVGQKKTEDKNIRKTKKRDTNCKKRKCKREGKGACCPHDRDAELATRKGKRVQTDATPVQIKGASTKSSGGRPIIVERHGESEDGEKGHFPKGFVKQSKMVNSKLGRK